MDFQLTTAQAKFLRLLVSLPEGSFTKEIKPALKPAERKQLAEGGMIQLDKRKPAGGSRAADYVCLTPQGRAWVESHPAPPPEAPKPKAPRKPAVRKPAAPKPAPSVKDFKATPKLMMLLLRLMLQPGGTAQVAGMDIKPSDADLKKAVKFGLVKATPTTLQPKQKFEQVELAEPGWLWMEQHLDEYTPSTKPESIVLHRLLTQMKSQVAAGRLSLADLCQPPSEAPARQSAAAGHIDAPLPDERPQPANLAQARQRIISACHRLSDGAYQTRIRLADLRATLPDIPRAEVDRALLDLEQSYAANIYPLDNPQEIEARDREAALANSMGSPRHILYLTGKE
ncbi:MAG: hypothetical protein AB7O62_11770 [Pirellulales bacterium]